VRQVSLNVFRPPPAEGWRADGHGGRTLLFLFLLRLRVADRGSPTLGHALLLQALIGLRVLDRRALLLPWHRAPPLANIDCNVNRYCYYNMDLRVSQRGDARSS